MVLIHVSVIVGNLPPAIAPGVAGNKALELVLPATPYQCYTFNPQVTSRCRKQLLPKCLYSELYGMPGTLADPSTLAWWSKYILLIHGLTSSEQRNHFISQQLYT